MAYQVSIVDLLLPHQPMGVTKRNPRWLGLERGITWGAGFRLLGWVTPPSAPIRTILSICLATDALGAPAYWRTELEEIDAGRHSGVS